VAAVAAPAAVAPDVAAKAVAVAAPAAVAEDAEFLHIGLL